MRKYLLLLVILSANLFGFAQTSTQTRTATLLNYNLHRVFTTNFATNILASSVAVNDGKYATSNKLSTQRSSSMLLLQGFQFNIPVDATIENIAVKARRFKTGKGETKDLGVRLVMRRETLPEWWVGYGVAWVNPNYFSATESEVNYSQTGSGIIVLDSVDYPYQWTPAKINDLYFGVDIKNFIPKEIKGASLVVSYDLVEITVEYSSPETRARKSPEVAETKPLREPIVYPNPFTTKTNLQFTASESGNAVVELYNISGTKVRTLFSGNVELGQVYTVAAGDALLPKGIYVYTIGNGKQKHTGKLIKVE